MNGYINKTKHTSTTIKKEELHTNIIFYIYCIYIIFVIHALKLPILSKYLPKQPLFYILLLIFESNESLSFDIHRQKVEQTRTGSKC